MKVLVYLRYAQRDRNIQILQISLDQELHIVLHAVAFLMFMAL